MSPDPFDDIDRALAGGLSALAPEVEDGAEALAQLRPRFQRARTRNRVMKVGGTIVALVAIASVATIAAPRAGRTHVRVSGPATTPAPVTKPTQSTTTSSTTTSVPNGNGSTPTTVTSTPPRGSQPGSSPTTPATVPGTTPATFPNRGDDNGHSGGGDGRGRGSSTGTTIPSAQNGTRRYESQGGSIRVRYSQGELSLVSVTAANGYQPSTHRNDPTEIDVRFESDQGGWRIRVRIEDGRVTSDVGHT